VIELTIAIPTYSRNTLVVARLRELLPQLAPGCRLLIIDNHSPVPVETTLSEAFSSSDLQNCRIVRNAVNIGGNANLIRCFELCETPWLWVLGDDDDVLPNAIATITETISANPELVFATFSSEYYARTSSFVTEGLEEFAEKIDSFLAAVFISTCLYNASKVRDRLPYAYHYLYSCAPHLLLVLMHLRDGGTSVFSDRQIISWARPPDDRGWIANQVFIWLSFTAVLEARLSPRARLRLARAMRKFRPELRVAARHLYYAGVERGEFETSKFFYDHLAYRLHYFEGGLWTRLHVFALRLPLMFPHVFGRLNAWSTKIPGRKVNPHGRLFLGLE
jgi:hypothetical protein